MGLSSLQNVREQFYFFPLYIFLLHSRHCDVRQCNLIDPCTLHIIHEAVCDNSIGKIFSLELGFPINS